MTLFSKQNYIDYLRGYTIYDCAMNNQNRYCFLLVEEKDDREILPRTRFVLVLGDNPPERRFGMYDTGKLTFCTIVRGTDPQEYVAVDMRSNVYSSNSARKGEETPIEKLIDMSTYRRQVGVVNKVVRAAGHLYAMGNYRRIYRRIGMEQWVELGRDGKGVPVPHDVEAESGYSMDLGFEDMSAFTADDMYAVGGKGDVWRFDGNTWHNCPVPTNASLSTVCCAGDGLVYITELNGTTWAGRGDKWEKVAKADIAWGYQPVDAVWFNDRLYLGAQEGLWTLDRSTRQIVPLGEVETDVPSALTSGRLDLSPDGKFLLTAGPHGACLNDGRGWRQLFSTFDFL